MKKNNLNFKDKKLAKVAFSHIGCEKNLVDPEHMQERTMNLAAM